MLFAQRPNAGCVKQGAIGDYFFIATTAVLAQAPSLIYSLFSPMCGGEPPPPPALERGLVARRRRHQRAPSTPDVCERGPMQ